jgi:hypothetical protein
MALSLLLLRRRLAWSTHQITKRRPNHLIEEFLFIESNKPDLTACPYYSSHGVKNSLPAPREGGQRSKKRTPTPSKQRFISSLVL